jgi:valyl-tRNA synthetase
LIATYSADAMRYWAASTRLGTDTFFSPDDLAASKRFITKLWNASRFAISHLQDVDFSVIPELLPIDKWIITRTDDAVIKATKLLNEYEIGSARHEVDDLFWKDYCDDYLEIIKERLYQPEVRGVEERRSGQYALYYALINILKLYAVYVPHITEYIYQEFFRKYEKKKSIHLLHWEKPNEIDTELLEFGEALKNSIAEMRKYKSDNRMSMRAEMETMNITAPDRLIPLFEKSEKDLLACSRAKSLHYVAHRK